MASVEKVLAKANAVDPGVRFTEDAAHWLSMIPFFARGGAIEKMIERAKQQGIDNINAEFILEASKDRAPF